MAWAPDYCTAEELAAFVRHGDATDARLALAIAAASRAVDKAARRQFGAVAAAEARYYTARWDALTSRWTVAIDDLMTTTDLAVAFDSDGDETYADTITAHTLRNRNAAAEGRPWTELAILSTSDVQPTDAPDAVRVTAVWGWSAVPDAVKQATLLQASRLLVRRDSPYGVAGSPEAGTEIRLLERLDPDVAVVLAPYRRRRKVVFA
ncbi:MAG: hypothetical protein JNM77_08780 [Pseudonocardia sp.]|nr:hypothetical protein [Pseudonocardia sp.]